MTDLNNDFSTYCADSLIAASATGLVLALEHVGLWPVLRHIDPHNELSPLFPYTVGTATIGAGLTALAIRWRDPRLAVAFWTVAGVGGVVVGGLRLYRRWLALEAEWNHENGHGAGQVAGARRYASEYQERSQAHRIA